MNVGLEHSSDGVQATARGYPSPPLPSPCVLHPFLRSRHFNGVGGGVAVLGSGLGALASHPALPPTSSVTPGNFSTSLGLFSVLLKKGLMMPA